VRNLRISILVTALALVSAALAGTALSASPQTTIKKIAFVGSYSGQASSKLDSSGSTAALAANGTGKATPIGAGTITGAGSADASQQPCPPFGGTGVISGAKGKIAFTVVTGSKGCGDDGGHNFTLVGYLAVTKATGVLAKAKGQLRFTGTYSRDDGTFSIKLTGTLKKPA